MSWSGILWSELKLAAIKHLTYDEYRALFDCGTREGIKVLDDGTSSASYFSNESYLSLNRI